jgi:hypothetical protein
MIWLATTAQGCPPRLGFKRGASAATADPTLAVTVRGMSEATSAQHLADEESSRRLLLQR